MDPDAAQVVILGNTGSQFAELQRLTSGQRRLREPFGILLDPPAVFA